MNIRLSIGLVGLLASVAFAAMPVAAQAVPHVYKNGVILPEGKILRGIWWGTLKMTNTKIGEMECHDIGVGFEENQSGGGPAAGKIQGLIPYECVSAACAALGGQIEVTAGKLPWIITAAETKPGVFREFIGAPPELETNCKGVVTVKYSEGGLDALIQNGMAIAEPGGLVMETLKVNPEAHDLKNGVETLETEGNLKYQGYAEQQLIEIKNP
jgi:hypothetical protein